MKHVLFILLCVISVSTFAQSEGQSFCDGDASASFFTLHTSKKYVIWQNTYYIEQLVGSKTLNGKDYLEYEQTWENGSKYQLYLREDSGTVYQFEDCCDEDTVRLPSKLEQETTWKNADKLVTYEVLSLDEELKTPICEYKNLLALKSIFKNGTFTFYYQKGYGYVGCTINGELISYVSPRKSGKN